MEWHFYLQYLLLDIVILPPSIHPGKIKNKDRTDKTDSVALHLRSLVTAYPSSIKLLDEQRLLEDRQRVEQQFLRMRNNKMNHLVRTLSKKQNDTDNTSNDSILSLPPEYRNSLQARDILDLKCNLELFDTSNVTMLDDKQRKIMDYIIARGDNTSQLTLVHDISNVRMHSVVATCLIPKGTSPIEYGGTCYIASQIDDQDNTKSTTWVLADHTDDRKTVLVRPDYVSNLARYINTTSCAEQRWANLAVIKVLDQRGNLRIRFIATRDIQPGEHLLYYYGKDYSTENFFSIEHLISNIKWIPV
jgi:hypothetical protein